MKTNTLLRLFSFKEFWIYRKFGGAVFNRFNPEYNEWVRPENLELVTREMIEFCWGPIEAQAVDSESGEVLVWTNNFVVYISDYDGLESLRAVPRHPPGNEPRS